MPDTEKQSVELIDAALVRRLIATQYPQWAHLTVEPVLPGGWDNRTFRLGDRMSVRLPSAVAYVAQVEKEHKWLPVLAPHLPLPIPVPIVKGAPASDYPWPWSVYAWLEGEPAQEGLIDNEDAFARSVASFLVDLHRVDVTDAPMAGLHNFYRGGSLSVYDGETRRALELLAGCIDTASALEVWGAAMGSTWSNPNVWVHGDLACGNLLVKDGKLHAVIDFGSSAVGDPACDLVIAWTMLGEESRHIFRSALALDDATWARGRGWALWKALITLAKLDESQRKVDKSNQVIQRILADQ
ncbi:phosphotransferase [Pseudomonas sp. CCM 7893]|uniref:Phosphotransferase n=1 Tax=Pseudomonas spelaei TaxID=1055469 RepID=A0A6I3WGW6_9PSED|nr:aminoglycoside phosphotransferase family protein [Pseudomonas spelaei]MUF05766.1 phosphotransferase [Pseudomonas spelaei]QLG93859.1 aminoglycoside phosphotransferase family protein [Pseudomonas yamanorum]